MKSFLKEPIIEVFSKLQLFRSFFKTSIIQKFFQNFNYSEVFSKLQLFRSFFKTSIIQI